MQDCLFSLCSSFPRVRHRHFRFEEREETTTAKVLLRNQFGQKRTIAALHGFSKSEEIFHSKISDIRIDEIDER
jgi:hypothetical protein